MKKLFACYAFGTDWENVSYLVGEDEETVKQRFIAMIEDDFGWAAGESVEEVKEIDGHKVIFKGKKIKLGDCK